MRVRVDWMFFICKDGHKKFDLVAFLITTTSVGLFIYLFNYLLFIYLSIYLFIYLFICLFICLFYPISREVIAAVNVFNRPFNHYNQR